MHIFISCPPKIEAPPRRRAELLASPHVMAPRRLCRPYHGKCLQHQPTKAALPHASSGRLNSLIAWTAKPSTKKQIPWMEWLTLDTTFAIDANVTRTKDLKTATLQASSSKTPSATPSVKKPATALR